MGKRSRVTKIIEAQRKADDLHDLLVNMPLEDPRWEQTRAAWRQALDERSNAERRRT
jgi:hypothetical protein